MLAAVLAVSVGSCSDDIDYRGSVVPDGEDAKLTLKVSVTEATHLSRATSDSYVKESLDRHLQCEEWGMYVQSDL